MGDAASVSFVGCWDIRHTPLLGAHASHPKGVVRSDRPLASHPNATVEDDRFIRSPDGAVIERRAGPWYYQKRWRAPQVDVKFITPVGAEGKKLAPALTGRVSECDDLFSSARWTGP